MCTYGLFVCLFVAFNRFTVHTSKRVSYQQTCRHLVIGRIAIRIHSNKMNMAFLWYVILCIIYMVSGFICKSKEKDSCHINVAAIPFAIGLNIDILFFIMHSIMKVSILSLILSLRMVTVQFREQPGKKIEYFRFLVTVYILLAKSTITMPFSVPQKSTEKR